MQDPWLEKGARRSPRSSAEVSRAFRALRVPQNVITALQRWAASPEQMKPLLRLIRDIVLSNAVHRARMKGAGWAAGAARDPHYKLTQEKTGALSPVLELVDRVIADLEELDNWRFNPPIE